MGIFSPVQAVIRQRHGPLHGQERQPRNPQGTYVSSRLPCTAVVANGAPKCHDVVLVPRFDLQAPNGGGKDVTDSSDLLALQTFNIAYDTGIFPGERYRIQLSG